jgi:hypothetical protein
MSSLSVFEGLNERQAAFAEHVIKGCKPSEAARLAGYSHFVQSSTNLLNSPAVLAAIHAGVQRALQAEAAPSLAVLKKIRDDDTAPARVRADIGAKLLAMAGHAPQRNKDGKDDKPISQMTQGELLEFIERNQRAIDDAEQQLANQAKDVTGAVIVQAGVPDAATLEPSALNYLD